MPWKVLLELYLTWMHDFKKDHIFREIVDTKQQFIDTKGFDWKEAMELAVNKRKFLLIRLFREQRVPKTVREHSEDELAGYYRT